MRRTLPVQGTPAAQMSHWSGRGVWDIFIRGVPFL